MYTVAGKTQWDAPITYASEEAFKISREIAGISGKIGSLEVALNKWNRQLNTPVYAVCRDEILEDIQKDSTQLAQLVQLRKDAVERFHAAGGVVTE